MNNLNTFLDFMELIWKKDSKIFESFVISNNQAISRIFESIFLCFYEKVTMFLRFDGENRV